MDDTRAASQLLMPKTLPSTLCSSVAGHRLGPLVSWLLLRFDPNMKDAKGRTLLHYAATCGAVDATRLLLRHKADVDARQNQLLTPLYMAACCGHLIVIEKLLSNGANVDLPDVRGFTPLMQAVRHGRFLAVESLVQRGANVDATNDDGLTAVDFVSMHRRRKMKQHLLAALKMDDVSPRQK